MMQIGKYKFLCKFTSDALLPYYKGSAFRGVFGHALKSTVCTVRHGNCKQCLLKSYCIYTIVFETRLAVGKKESEPIGSPPPPYVIEPVLSPESYYPRGAAFNFVFILFGNANRWLPFFIHTFDKMGNFGIGRRIDGKRGRFQLKSVMQGDQLIFTEGGKEIRPFDPPAAVCLSDRNQFPKGNFRLRLFLETPLRFKTKGRLTTQLKFEYLVRAMLRRVSSLSEYYGDTPPVLDFHGLVEQSKTIHIIENHSQWFDWKRYSSPQDQKMNFGGLTGTILYEGELNPFMPLVEFCCKVHIGKQTTFGLGKISAEIIC